MPRRGLGGGTVTGPARRPSGQSRGGPRKPRSGQRSGRGRAGEPGLNRGDSRPPKRGPGGNRLGGDQVEGRQAVRELLLAGTRTVREVLLADDLDQAGILDDITTLARELHVPVRTLPRRRLANEASSSAPQGVIARADPLPERSLDKLAANPAAFLLVLDGITDPGNLGALLRTAECAGVTGVILPRHRAAHITPTVTKASAGAIEHLPIALVGGVPSALSDLAAANVLTIGLDAGGDGVIFDLPPAAAGPVALVLGAEGPGLSRLVRKRVDLLVAIPLFGELNSLNVATAGAVACFELVRHREAGAAHDHGARPEADWGLP